MLLRFGQSEAFRWVIAETKCARALADWISDPHEFTHKQQSADVHIIGMVQYHNLGFGTIPECNTSVSIP